MPTPLVERHQAAPANHGGNLLLPTRRGTLISPPCIQTAWTLVSRQARRQGFRPSPSGLSSLQAPKAAYLALTF